jgi:hypothetical protein
MRQASGIRSVFSGTAPPGSPPRSPPGSPPGAPGGSPGDSLPGSPGDSLPGSPGGSPGHSPGGSLGDSPVGSPPGSPGGSVGGSPGDSPGGSRSFAPDLGLRAFFELWILDSGVCRFGLRYFCSAVLSIRDPTDAYCVHGADSASQSGQRPHISQSSRKGSRAGIASPELP